MPTTIEPDKKNQWREKLLAPDAKSPKTPIDLITFIENIQNALKDYKKEALKEGSEVSAEDRQSLEKTAQQTEKNLTVLTSILENIYKGKSVGVSDISKLTGMNTDYTEHTPCGEKSLGYIKILIEAINILATQDKNQQVDPEIFQGTLGKIPSKISLGFGVETAIKKLAPAALLKKPLLEIASSSCQSQIKTLSSLIDNYYINYFKDFTKELTALSDETDKEKHAKLIEKIKQKWQSFSTNTGVYKPPSKIIKDLHNYYEWKYLEEIKKVKTIFSKINKNPINEKISLSLKEIEEYELGIKELEEAIENIQNIINQDETVQATVGSYEPRVLSTLKNKVITMKSKLQHIKDQASQESKQKTPANEAQPKSEPISTTGLAQSLQTTSSTMEQAQDTKEKESPSVTITLPFSRPATPPLAKQKEEQSFFSSLSSTVSSFFSGSPKPARPEKKQSPKAIATSEPSILTRASTEQKNNVEEAMQEVVKVLIEKVIRADHNEARPALDNLAVQLTKYQTQAPEQGVNYDSAIKPLISKQGFNEKAKNILIEHYLATDKKDTSEEAIDQAGKKYKILGEEITKPAQEKVQAIKLEAITITERIDNEKFLTSHDYRQETEQELAVHNHERLLYGMDTLNLNTKIEQNKDKARKILTNGIANDLLKKYIEKHENPIIADVKKFKEECKGLDITQQAILSKASKISTGLPLRKEHDEILARLTDPKHFSDSAYQNKTMLKLEAFKKKCEKIKIDCPALTDAVRLLPEMHKKTVIEKGFGHAWFKQRRSAIVTSEAPTTVKKKFKRKK